MIYQLIHEVPIVGNNDEASFEILKKLLQDIEGKDIPEIIDGAVRDMKIDIPVRTTDPVGSNTQMMLGLIHSSVTSTSQVLRNQQQQQQQQ